MPLIVPKLQGQAFLEDVMNQRQQTEHFHIWWLGQSGYLLQWKGRHVLIDPYLSDSLTEKYAGTDKPHIRMSERVIDPENLDFIDVVTSSHNHTDHLDAATLVPLFRKNPLMEFLVPEANRDFVCERLGLARDFPVALNAGENRHIGSFIFHGVPASHNEVERDEHGNCRFMGYVIEFGKWKIYHSGDTLWYPGMEDILKPFHVDLALLPINGNDPARKVAGNLDGREAALLAKAIGARLVIPCHYHMFTFNSVEPDLFIQSAESVLQPYKVLEQGESFSSSYFG